MKRYSLWAAAMVCLIISLQQAAPVYACSGYGQIATGELIELADIAVVGRFVELDSVRMNGIFRVSSYLMGEPGPEYLLLALNSPIQIERQIQLRPLSGECSTTAGEFNTSDTIVVFLRQRPDGGYERLSVQSGLYAFPHEAAQVEVFLYYPKTYEEFPFRTFTFDNLIKYISVTSGQDARPPLENMPYPLTAPIGITTEAGTEYVLPVDGSPPHVLTDDERAAFDHDRQGCAQPGCVAYSPNGLDRVELLAEPAAEIIQPMFIGSIKVSGDALLFSPTSANLAVWALGWIHVYPLYYPLIGYEEYEIPKPVNRMSVRGYEDVIGAGVWSPDGRMLAYSDAEGLWLWDVFSIGDAPRLVLAAHDGVIPYARYFSPMGRYLAVTDGRHGYHIDLVSGQQTYNGLISPDERVLLIFNPDTTGQLDIQMRSLTGTGLAASYTDLAVMDVEWIDSISFFMVRCVDDDPDIGKVRDDGDECVIFRTNIRLHGQQSAEGFAFDYDPAADKLVTIVEGSTITIDAEERDLAPYLDSAAAEIKWLPSLYYH